jgi:hypothetical protein
MVVNGKIADIEVKIMKMEATFGKLLRQMFGIEQATSQLTGRKLVKKIVDITKMTDAELIAWYAETE